MRRFTILLVLAISVFVVTLAASGYAEDISSTNNTVKDGEPKPRLSPLSLPGGSTLTLVSRDEWSPLVSKLSTLLMTTHEHYDNLFGKIPPFTVIVRLMEENQFYKSTGAPRWTNAMYYKGEITIPLAQEEKVDLENLYRSIKHEYTHAVIHSLSSGRCPGWLDEGLAQWAEGPANPALEPALKSWLSRHAPVPLAILQGGFTKLQNEMVPPAYAQSLFATKNVITEYGFGKIRDYMKNLREGSPKDMAFRDSFNITTEAYERRLGITLNKWRDAGDDDELQSESSP